MRDLDDIIGQLDRIPTPNLWEGIRHSGPHRGPVEPPQRGRRAIAALVAILLAVGSTVFLVRAFRGGEADRQPIQEPTPTSTPSSSPSPAPSSSLADVSPGWTELSVPPEVRTLNSATVWTGSELLVWGGYVYTGYSNEVALASGFRWEPVSGASSPLAAAPLAARTFPAFAWTGTELLIWGGTSAEGTFADGAAYSPGSDTWRSMAQAPLDAGEPGFHIWTGRELIVFGDYSLDPTALNGAAYHPATDTWRPIPSPPAGYWFHPVWTGSEVVVFANLQVGDVQTAAYDPDADRWRILPRTPLDWIATAAWDGHGVVAWAPDTHRIARLDPTSGDWTMLPSAPLPENNYQPKAAGGPGFVVGVQAGETVVLDVARARWRDVTQDSLFMWDTNQIVEAGNVIITLRRNNGTGKQRAFVFRP